MSIDWNSPRDVLKVYVILYSFQTASEKISHNTNVLNNVGFNSADAPFLTDVFQRTILLDRPPTEGQYNAVKSILRKYDGQVADLDLSKVSLPEQIEKTPFRTKDFQNRKGDGILNLSKDGSKLEFLPFVFPSTQVKSLGWFGRKEDGKFWWECNFSIDKVHGLLDLFPKIEVSTEVENRIALAQKEQSLPDNVRDHTVLFDFQKEAIQFLMSHKRAMLALAPGLGKTACAAIAGNNLKNIKHALVISPKTLMINWKREIKRWTGEDSEIWHGRIGEGKAKWIIANYETAVRKLVKHEEGKRIDLSGNSKNTKVGWKAILPFQFDLIIIDESVMVKNRHAQRTKAMKVLSDMVDSVWELSGAPITRFYDDLWAQLNILDYRRFRSYWRFANEYCIVQFNGWADEITNNQPDAKDKIDRNLRDIYFARTQDQVLDLPEFIFDDYEVQMGEEQYKIYNEMEKAFLAHLTEENIVISPNVLSQLIRLVQFASNPVLLDGKDEGAKWDAVHELLKFEKLPAIIWTSFLKTAKLMNERLSEAGYRSAVLTGETPDKKRQEIVDKFQAGELDVLIAHPGVGKFGLTLTAAHTAIYLERNFNGDDYYQSLHRVRRIGTTSSPHIIHLIAAKPDNGGKTVDHVISEVLKFRKDSVSKLTTGMIRDAWNIK